MPTLAVNRDDLFKHLGKTYTDVSFDELCFEFGVELDEITSEREEAVKSSTVKLSKSELAALSDAVIYKIDVPANRYDLLCMEGLVRAIKIFLGDIEGNPSYGLVLEGDKEEEQMKVLPATKLIRPFAVCAILRDVSFDQERYQSFLDLQDQLHRNLCRNRTLVAIGTHDLDSIEGPFVYNAEKPEDIKFVPLTHDEELNAKDLLEVYATDPACKHLKPYVSIIEDSPVYPVIRDANGVVLSLPPLINGAHSKITLDTKNVFIECTATDLTKANIVLDTVVTMFSEHAAKPFTAEPVEVLFQNEEGEVVNEYVTPELKTRKEYAGVEFVNSLIGIHVTGDKMVELCEKVQLGPARLLEDGKTLEVTIPPTRSDILHAVDVAEDIGIAFGYNNIVKKVPATCTVGGEQPLNTLTDLLREEISRAGYTEVLTHGLSSIHDNFTALNRPITPAVSLLNPANIEYQVVRTTLLPGLLKTLQHNKSASFTKGFKLFEISDVVLPDDNHVVCESVVGAKNSRRVCAVYAGPTSGFEIIHGLVDRIMTLCEVAPVEAYVKNSAKGDEEKFRVARDGWYYTISEMKQDGDDAATYFPGRCAEILLDRPQGEQIRIGSFGILHPKVLKNFDIQYPASSIELHLEEIL
mmetsp:Transcript_24559/g.36032  ORF Transcript_24559/g.36032 Transcript_24559/m.36032 type:complete len:638 (-) Transcript_24559:327-2240(-)|eukprot:CAMPEP_0195522290 /NCGR_PEP_ID=MMETSP0794_2-20130614/20280_1 /TAXON_ID=515487 /ORGANISM="Stephanopyxis turris, Strain CCMP 815" /LENGTH=637 /DNA_ID=CAMNT_0040652009 /DNA_START=215 /DNA_END=2128 /DNA_ORIENTATION=-